MEQVVIRRLRDGTLDDYKRVAAAKGRSLEAELRELIERNRPLRKKDSAYLLALSERLQAMTPDGARLLDSTDLIRWDRDTNHGDWVDDGWQDDDAGC